MTHWADSYVGLPAEGRWPCWQLVRSVWEKQLGFILPTFDELNSKSEAIRIGSSKFSPIRIGDEKEYDAVMINVPVKVGLKSWRNEEAHIGVVVKPGLVLHVHEKEHSKIESILGQSVSRIIRGPWQNES